MTIKIVPFGDMGSTEKAAEILAENIEGAVICGSLGEATDSDILVVGVNIHFGKFNKRFVKEFKKIGITSPVYIYLVGAQIEKQEEMTDKMRALIPDALGIKYVWGELKTEGARGLKKFAIQSFIDGRRKDGLPKPKLLDKVIKAFAHDISKSAQNID